LIDDGCKADMRPLVNAPLWYTKHVTPIFLTVEAWQQWDPPKATTVDLILENGLPSG
jgi:hypothetical protein